jgi:hypothetical protein
MPAHYAPSDRCTDWLTISDRRLANPPHLAAQFDACKDNSQSGRKPVGAATGPP